MEKGLMIYETRGLAGSMPRPGRIIFAESAFSPPEFDEIPFEAPDTFEDLHRERHRSVPLQLPIQVVYQPPLEADFRPSDSGPLPPTP